MDGVLDILNTALNWLLDAVMTVFDVLFGWLPSDPFINTISEISTFMHAQGLAVSWLNWFIDLGFFISVFGLAVTALVLWTGFRIINYLFDKAVKAISVAKI